jgi:maltooligosyltrehalose trehalohydrolase
MHERRFLIGAEPAADRGTSFRVWAPAARRVEVVERRLDVEAPGRSHALERESDGYFSGFVPDLMQGGLYSLRLDGKAELYPDPASRFQPRGPHGPSQVVDPSRFAWTDARFRGTPERGQVIYETHIGTFTREGTYAAALEHLPKLRELGVTTLELMPLAEFPGEFGWGYDGVDLWAPTRLYGQPDDLRRFVDRAHALGLGVILDVVYNHFGPDGCYLKAFAPGYFTDRYANEWGEALNFDGENSGPVRAFFCENARYWIAEYHLDGLRLDATQSILDASERHVIADITSAARRAAAESNKRIYISAENEPQCATLVGDPARGRYGCDALWNDDFHHIARVALSGRREAYYHDYTGKPQEFISALKWGYLYQGQHYFWQKKRRGQSALELKPHNYVTYLQNHDQIANSLRGARATELTSAASLRAMTTLWLLAPPTPMLFQGQEFAASSPFYYFADHQPELAQRVSKGRREFLAQFPSVAQGAAREHIPDPKARSTFEACKLDHGERERHAAWYALHKDLLALRRADSAFSLQRSDFMHGSVLSAEAFLLRFFYEAGDRLVLVNFGPDLELHPAPEPLLAPPAGHTWQLALCSEDVKYGGAGFTPPFDAGVWRLSARSASALVAVPDASTQEHAG